MSQTMAILSRLKRGYPITPIYALNHFGCMRLAARINEIRDKGYTVDMRMVRRGDKRYASYSLCPRSRGGPGQLPHQRNDP